jgi:hypothetical protein
MSASRLSSASFVIALSQSAARRQTPELECPLIGDKYGAELRRGADGATGRLEYV